MWIIMPLRVQTIHGSVWKTLTPLEQVVQIPHKLQEKPEFGTEIID